MAAGAKGLTAKQQAFVQEYLVDLNASAAARRAGYNFMPWEKAQGYYVDNSEVRVMTKKAHRIRHIKKRAFLAAFAETGNVSKAAEIAEIHRSMHYHWLGHDANYVTAFAAAEDEAADRLETEARRRAVEGVEEPVFYKGEECGTVRKYSDTLLIFLLNGAKPEKYKQRVASELTGKDGKPIQFEHTILPASEVDRRLAELAEPTEPTEKD